MDSDCDCDPISELRRSGIGIPSYYLKNSRSIS
jgi:hypothetical protein